uniref:Uncharacterized protein n=1 Tax=Arundo donax TaxID=35708 RepID=A0A0A9H4T1_ARUDO
MACNPMLVSIKATSDASLHHLCSILRSHHCRAAIIGVSPELIHVLCASSSSAHYASGISTCPRIRLPLI